MEGLLDDYNSATLCRVLDVPRTSFYYYCKHNEVKRKIKTEKLKELIQKIWYDSEKRYGSPKITTVLENEYNIHISRKTVQNLMKEMNVASIITKSYKPEKFKPDEGTFENLLKRDFTTGSINEKWVSDITYIKTDECGWCYLATIMDLHSKRLIGWKFGKKMTVELVEAALENALAVRGLNKLLILHSDRGSQYTAEVYRRYSEENDIKLSYSAKGCPYDNAVMESFNAIIKKELVNHTHYETFNDAYISIFTFIEKWYNRKRIHGSIKNMTPVEYENLIVQN
jgi:transposase InsO family protein